LATKIYDIIIIGAGPAGITAAVYAARKRMDLLVLTGDIGGQTTWSGDVENYTGYQFITGADLAGKFEEHMKTYKVPVKQGEEVTAIRKEGNIVIVNTREAEYMAKTAVIASGKRSKELGIPGEKEFRNKGLTYCATCDGPLFAGKDVAVVGGGNSALDAVLQLMNIANRIYVINITRELGGDAIMREKALASGKVTVLNGTKVIGVLGDKFVKGVKVEKDGTEKTLDVQGVFVEIGLEPNSGFAGSFGKNELGEIKVNCRTETNVPGVFAAGDVTNVPEKQIIIAAGEGAKAALEAFRYISKAKKDDWSGDRL
jgi:alkyl hydroperoxide reductase subunit F